VFTRTREILQWFGHPVLVNLWDVFQGLRGEKPDGGYSTFNSFKKNIQATRWGLNRNRYFLRRRKGVVRLPPRLCSALQAFRRTAFQNDLQPIDEFLRSDAFIFVSRYWRLGSFSLSADFMKPTTVPEACFAPEDHRMPLPPRWSLCLLCSG